MTILKQLSQNIRETAMAVSGRLVHIGGEDIPYRTGIRLDADTIITTALSAEEGEEVSVLLPDGAVQKTVVSAFDSKYDIVLLKAEEKADISEWEGADPELGMLAVTLAFASPAGIEARLDLIRLAEADYFQTDGQAYPGFSGAAVVDPDGKLAGIVNSNLDGNYGQAIPFSRLKEITAKLKAGGSRKKRSLGVRTQPAENGLLITEIISGSAAEKAGLLVGDILLKAAGQELNDIFSLLQALDDSEGETELAVSRGGKEITVKALPDQKAETVSRRHGRMAYRGHHHCCN